MVWYGKITTRKLGQPTWEATTWVCVNLVFDFGEGFGHVAQDIMTSEAWDTNNTFDFGLSGIADTLHLNENALAGDIDSTPSLNDNISVPNRPWRIGSVIDDPVVNILDFDRTVFEAFMHPVFCAWCILHDCEDLRDARTDLTDATKDGKVTELGIPRTDDNAFFLFEKFPLCGASLGRR